MLGTVAPTPYDLNFSLFGIPVRVHPMFWVVSAIMGWRGGQLNLMLIYVVCVFVSILVHELGHAWTAKSYGWPPHIVLYAFGGYASYIPAWGRSTGKTILILFAGPGAGFLLYGLICGLEYFLQLRDIVLGDLAWQAISDLKWINLAWGLMNLLPVYPLDGGQITHAALCHVRPRDGENITFQISIAVAVGIAVLAFWAHDRYVALLFGMLAFENLQLMQRGRFR